MPETAALSLVIPTFRRAGRLAETLERVGVCVPGPAEVIVHVDAGDTETAPMLAERFPEVRVLVSEIPLGPGGARNRLVAAALHDLIVSLDDDSYPIDGDFFAAVSEAFDAHPRAGALAMTIVHEDEETPARGPGARTVADFVGCGCAYRRAAFLATSGYLPLHPAYGMEEADLALQLLDGGWEIVHRDDLRVRHATDRSHQAASPIVAAHVRNTALLAFLRYPLGHASLGAAQFANRVLYSTRRGHLGGVLRGILQTPATLLRYRTHRRPVRADTVTALRALRRRPIGEADRA
ncbi:glycosyltransferase family 2 protein [Roseitranquillus sediminis]|uniref:glycosyltransferase family 2 protein n=1 Tax=Roseitranquillus sediminis TaxID=2809051 RepID=UPI001D0C3991|nr:glycosyltransferase family 2 protein [Roseitranquillus sediminis]MBM9594014.1 glycosyltransferase family 2 protein [Roseitranquillus sediminis]